MSLFLQLPSTSSCGFINNWFDTSLLMDIWGYFQSVAFPIHVTSYFANVVSLRTGITGLSYQWNFSRLGHILLRRHWVVLLPATCESRVSPQSCPKSATSNLWFFFSPAPLGKAKWLLSSICSISLIRLWGVHQGYGLQTLVSRTCSRWGSHLCFVSNNNITGKTERLGHHTGKG